MSSLGDNSADGGAVLHASIAPSTCSVHYLDVDFELLALMD